MRPAPPLQARRRRALVGPTEAQPAEGGHPIGGADQDRELAGLEQGHPSHPEPLRPGGQPEVLDGAGARPHVGVDEGGPAQHAGRRGPPVAAHDQAERRLPDAFQVEVEQVAGRVGCHGAGLRQAGPVGHDCRPGPGGGGAHQHEPPRLRMADGGGGVGRGQHPGQDVLVDRIGPEAPDVAAGGQDPVQHLALVGRKGPTRGVGRARVAALDGSPMVGTGRGQAGGG